jgi:Flp pilus assembly pilin Flp
MSSTRDLLVRFVRDESGDDLVEYALLTAIVSVGGVVLFASIADAMATAYTNWETAAETAWEPCPPAPASCP